MEICTEEHIPSETVKRFVSDFPEVGLTLLDTLAAERQETDRELAQQMRELIQKRGDACS